MKNKFSTTDLFQTLIKATMLGMVLSGNVKGAGKLIVAKADGTSNHIFPTLQADLSPPESEVLGFLSLSMKAQNDLLLLTSGAVIEWTLEKETIFRDAIAAYTNDLNIYNAQLAKFIAHKANYESLKTSASQAQIETVIAELTQEYQDLLIAYEILVDVYSTLNVTRQQREQFFGEEGDITSWILAEMGYDYGSNQFYKVNYTYTPSLWRRIFQTANPESYLWSTKGHADIFSMSISPMDDLTKNAIPSFCAYLGSHHFAGEGEGNTGGGYLLDVNPFDNDFASQGGRDMTEAQYDKIISAYNYIYDSYHQLDGYYRIVTQVVTWMILDDAFTFDVIQEGLGGTLEILEQNGHDVSYGGLTEDEIRLISEALQAAQAGYKGTGQIYAFLYLVGVGADGQTIADPMQAQPQIVPIYTVDVPIISEYLSPEKAIMDITEFKNPEPEQEKKKETTVLENGTPIEIPSNNEPLVTGAENIDLPETGFSETNSFILSGTGLLAFGTVLLALKRKNR